MKTRVTGVLLLAMLAGCASSGLRMAEWEEGEGEGEREMGPPPPGYWRIVAEAVPGWTPAQMSSHTDGPGMWSLVGPKPMTNEYWSGNANAGGRTVGIAVDPTNASVVYIATASGGVWKTTDAGANWTPLTDELSNLNQGAICIDPSNHNTVYIGTGEYTGGSGGDGVFRSTDAGATWTRIGTTAQVGTNISRIAVDPTNPLVIHVSGTLGYVRSTDGGATWSTRLAGGACSDLAVNPSNPQIVYVGRHSSGIYRSTDGGTTFSVLGGGLPASGMTRILLALAPSAPSTVYATLINTSSGLLGEYKTIDGGTTWTLLSGTPNYPSPQGGYDCFTIVHPTDPNTVYAGGVFPSYAVAGIIKTTNGGTSWTDVTVVGGTQVHPDMQTAAFGPDGTLWVGCDGGVWKTTNGAASWVNCNATLAATQHYQIALHPTDPNNTIGGTQDNGTAQRNSASLGWPQILSGDGGFCCYDRATPTRRYVTYVYLSVYRVTSGGTVEISGPWSGDSVQFIAPLVADPNSATTLLGGTNRVWRTTNATLATVTWTAISTSTVGGGGTLSAIAVAPGASNTIYTGSTTGQVWQTTDASIWNNRSAGLPGGNISDIIVNPTNPAVAYVSVSSSTGNRVLRTDTSGTSWTNKTGTLPSGVRGKALEIDWRFTPPVMYVGTGVGIYWSFDDGATWTKDGADLPNVNIGDLRIDPTLLTITAGTYGRGVWRANLLSPAAACYANCDNSTTPPILNVQDFACFLNKFAASDTYANCDNSTTPPVLNVQDFACFLNKFAAGCS